ncbi:HlyD family secretion protein [Erwinia sp. BC051422]|uniref:HlyD family secretion protein n=1 Tax=Erwinia wuhanensis TaxID=3045167 RepID=UPI002655DEA1|nr:HlyD family secretion protein [Erwinia sp. BC051422]MDN8540479.1 HlyD family secretion protein [Erwinia sp. BC051422]
MNSSLYRQSAITHRTNVWKGKALLVRGLPVWVHLLITAIFLISLTLLLTFGSYTHRVTVSGELASVPRPVTVASPDQGFVINKFVSPGDNVKKGQPLYEINISRTTRSGVVSVQHRQSTQEQLRIVDDIIGRLRENRRITLATLEQEKASYAAAFEHSTKILKQAASGLKEMKQNMESYRRYQQAGLINRDQLSQQTSLFYQQQNDHLTLSGQREQNALQVLALEGDIRTRAADFDNEIFRMEMQRSVLARQNTEDDASGTLLITSPVNGRVDTVSLTLGQSTRSGDTLAQIIPDVKPHWELVMWIPDSALPFIKTDAPVNIRYSAFPSEKFGLFPGRIAEVSVTPAGMQERSHWASAPGADTGIPQTWYRLTITPDVTHFVWQGQRLKAGNGLRADCTLFLEKRRLWQWVLSPLYEMRDSTRGAING